MKVINNISEMREFSREEQRAGRSIAVVPTMGYLHEGHLSLVDTAFENADTVIVTIFVNPSQFGPGEDFDKYPRNTERDLTLCRERGVDAVFVPSMGDMYPEGFSTWVSEEKLSSGLCGRSRPSHFRGVTTVVSKLFNIVLPDVAVFGRKDYQQSAVIKRMVRDLNFPVRIITAPIVREKDGLAMSSRNKYLSAEERRKALSIYNSLKEAEKAVAEGERSSLALVRDIEGTITLAGGRVDYVEVLDAENLKSLDDVTGTVLVAVAAFFGNTRLIDNITVSLN